MSNRVAVGLLLSVLLSPVFAAEPPAASTHPTGPQEVRVIVVIHDIPSYLDRLNETVKLAKQGEYGKLSKHDRERIDVARSRILSILGDLKDDSSLTDDQRREVFNEQELIAGILRSDDDNRIVCTHEPQTGTRLPGPQECLTVGQRKARSAQARDATRAIQDKGLLGGVAQ